MSVLIKGMKFPDMCGHCRFATAFDCGVDGQFIPTHDARRKDCPLIEVPPHGRLIDADEFEEENAYFWNRDFINSKYSDTLADLVNDAPTIIPAEEGET